jgi:hypothetical protein
MENLEFFKFAILDILQKVKSKKVIILHNYKLAQYGTLLFGSKGFFEYRYQELDTVFLKLTRNRYGGISNKVKI